MIIKFICILVLFMCTVIILFFSIYVFFLLFLFLYVMFIFFLRKLENKGTIHIDDGFGFNTIYTDSGDNFSIFQDLIVFYDNEGIPLWFWLPYIYCIKTTILFASTTAVAGGSIGYWLLFVFSIIVFYFNIILFRVLVSLLTTPSDQKGEVKYKKLQIYYRYCYNFFFFLCAVILFIFLFFFFFLLLGCLGSGTILYLPYSSNSVDSSLVDSSGLLESCEFNRGSKAFVAFDEFFDSRSNGNEKPLFWIVYAHFRLIVHIVVHNTNEGLLYMYYGPAFVAMLLKSFIILGLLMFCVQLAVIVLYCKD